MNRRTITITLTTIIFAVIMTSCLDFFKNFTKNKETTVDYIPVQLSEGSSWVFVDHTGARIGNQEWEFEPTVSKNGVFIAQADSGLTVYKWHKDVAEPVEGLTKLVSAGSYNEGVIPVCGRMERIRIADADGKTVFTLDPIEGKEVSSCALAMHDGMLIISDSKGKSGAVDKEGNLVVKPIYDMMSDYSDGVALAMKYPTNMEDDPEFFVVDKEGKETKIKAKIGMDNLICGIEAFSHGSCYMSAPLDTSYTTTKYVKISPNGNTVVTDTLVGEWAYLDNNSYIEAYVSNDKNVQIWKDPNGKTIKKFTDGYCMADKKFLVFSESYNFETNTKPKVQIFNLEGQEIAKFTGNYSEYCPGGEFGLIVTELSESWEPTSVIMIDEEGKNVPDFKFFNCGMKEDIMLNDMGEEGECERATVNSAYIDMTAAASTMAKMLGTGMVKGKETYYIGQSVADVLKGSNARFYSGKDRTFEIPTDTITWTLGEGPGFRINGEATSSTNIVAPTYKKYFDTVYTDYYGTRWGYWRQKQTGVVFNSKATVESFDLKLSTNYPSGHELREGLKRHLKKSGFTLVASSDNYDEYHNGNDGILIYGSTDSNGVGAIVSNKSKLSKLTDSEKSALAATL